MIYRIARDQGGNGQCPRLEGAKCGVAQILHAYKIKGEEVDEISSGRLAAEHCSHAGTGCRIYDSVRSGVDAGIMYDEVCKRLENPEDQEHIREELLSLMNISGIQTARNMLHIERQKKARHNGYGVETGIMTISVPVSEKCVVSVPFTVPLQMVEENFDCPGCEKRHIMPLFGAMYVSSLFVPEPQIPREFIKYGTYTKPYTTFRKTRIVVPQLGIETDMPIPQPRQGTFNSVGLDEEIKTTEKEKRLIDEGIAEERHVLGAHELARFLQQVYREVCA
jgi:hypothetical protein